MGWLIGPLAILLGVVTALTTDSALIGALVGGVAAFALAVGLGLRARY